MMGFMQNYHVRCGSMRTQAINGDCRDIILDRLTNLCRDIPHSVATLIKQMVVEFYLDISQLCRDVNK